MTLCRMNILEIVTDVVPLYDVDVLCRFERCLSSDSDVVRYVTCSMAVYVFYPRQKYTGLLWTILAESEWSVRWIFDKRQVYAACL